MLSEMSAADSVALADVEDRHDVRVRELRRRLRLAREAHADGDVVRELRRQDLDRDRAVEPQVAGAVHDRHAPATDFALDRILVAEGGDYEVLQ